MKEVEMRDAPMANGICDDFDVKGAIVIAVRMDSTCRIEVAGITPGDTKRLLVKALESLYEVDN